MGEQILLFDASAYKYALAVRIVHIDYADNVRR
jgi:hypothetical protein